MSFKKISIGKKWVLAVQSGDGWSAALTFADEHELTAVLDRVGGVKTKKSRFKTCINKGEPAFFGSPAKSPVFGEPEDIPVRRPGEVWSMLVVQTTRKPVAHLCRDRVGTESLRSIATGSEQDVKLILDAILEHEETKAA